MRGATTAKAEDAIGVFDSGVGGLTVLAALRRALPDEKMVYLGDTARVPYGTRSADVVVRYAKNNARTLLELSSLKMLVVACNTASAVAIDELVRTLPIPVVGVIEPGAEAAARATKGGTIAVLGTPGTVRSGAYVRALAARGRARVVARACPLFVPLVEEGWTSGPVVDLVAEKYLAELPADVDTVVLGCTHYPLLRASIAARFPTTVAIVDSGEASASHVKALLDERGLRAQTARAGAADDRFFVTDAPEQMATLAPRFLGEPVAQVEQVDVAFGPE